MRWNGILILLASVAVWGPAQSAISQEARPQYVRSDPKGGAVVHRAPKEVVATFDKPLDPSSEMTVFDPCGDEISSSVEVEGANLAAQISGKTTGTYVARYSADSREGALSTAGTFSFEVHAGPRCDGQQGHTGGHDGNKGKGGAKVQRAGGNGDRVSPEMGLALALAIPTVVGILGGVVLRRRFASE